MTTKTKCRLLDVAGAVISFAAPAVATVAEFPRVEQSITAGGNTVADILNISSAAFSIICILLAVSCWRFFREHLKLPKSGLVTSIILYVIAYGVESFIHSFRVIMFWAVIGCAVAQALYIVSDIIERKGTP